MSVVDKIKKIFKKGEGKVAYSAMDLELIELFKKLEKEGFHYSKTRECVGSFMDKGDSFSGYDITQTLFQDGIMVVKKYSEKEFSSTNVQKEDDGKHYIVSKNEQGEFIVERHYVKKYSKFNHDLKGFDLHVDIDGRVVNMDSELSKYYDMTPKFEECLRKVNKLERVARMHEETQEFFKEVIKGVENGSIKPKIQAKCVCVDARQATPEEVGTQFTVYSHGKVEKNGIVLADTVFVTTLDRNGDPVIDENGNTNTYDMSLSKFKKKYQKHENGHYVQDPTPMVTIELPDSMIPEAGVQLLPPCWRGYEGTLMRGGLIMLPFNPLLSREKQIAEWKKYLTSGENVDWYPNNEPETYAVCDRCGIFKDEQLRELYGQVKADEYSL